MLHPRNSGYLQQLIKLALKDVTTQYEPGLESLVESVIRMPGPLDKKRSFKGSTSMPTEVSKQPMLKSLKNTSEVGNDVKTHTIEKIN